MFPIVYIYTVWFQFLHRINAAFGVSQKFVPYRPPYDQLQTKPTLPSGNLTSALAENYADGTVCGYTADGGFGSLSGVWLLIRTYSLNRSSTRKIQIAEAQNGTRLTRFYNDSGWGAWT